MKVRGVFRFLLNNTLREKSVYLEFSGPNFPAFDLNKKRYGLSPYSFRIWENTDHALYGQLSRPLRILRTDGILLRKYLTTKSSTVDI